MLDFYSTHEAITSPGNYADVLDRLPSDIEALVRIVQGLVIHEFVAASFYGVTIPNERRGESHIRPVESMLDRIFELDDRPLTVARPPERRLAGVCRHYMVLLLTLLRAKGIPARGSCGYGPRLNPGFFEDHVVCEYWNAAEERWSFVDSQLDDAWRTRLGISTDVLSLPADWFVTASDAWTRCRAGTSDAKKFGIFRGDLRGEWFLAVNLIHEVALLNKVEPLRWDAWGAMPRPNESLRDDQMAFFDELAALLAQPDDSFEELRRRFHDDQRLRVPAKVFNVVLNREDTIRL